jgi:hypothetical protein
LAVAIEISAPPGLGLTREVILRDILENLGALLVITRYKWLSNEEVVEFRHLSIRDYFFRLPPDQKFSLAEERDNEKIAECCLLASTRGKFV